MSRYLRGLDDVRRTRRRGTEFFYLMILAVVLVVIMLWITAKQSSLLSVGYDIAELRDQNAALMEEQAKLREELAVLRRPDRIWGEARSMGLLPIGDENRYRVELVPAPEEEPLADNLVAEANREP